MGAVKIQQFGGMLPAWDPHLLPDGQGADCLNAYLFSGAMIGWRTPKFLRTLQNSAAQKVYRIPVLSQAAAYSYLVFLANPNSGDTVTVGEETYTFTNAVVDAYDVLLGANAGLTSVNLTQAFLATGIAGTTYGDNTFANPVLDTTKTGTSAVTINSVLYQIIQTTAVSFGASYNTTKVAESTGNVRMTWLYSLSSLTDTTTTFQFGQNQTFDNTITGNATWLEFVDPYTDVIKSPVVDDQYNRYYFASPSQPPQYNTYDRIQANANTFQGQPAPPWLLGVPAPACAPGVSVSGGGDLALLGHVSFTNSNTAIPDNAANVIFMIPITPTGAMTLNDVVFMPQSTNANANFTAVLYDDNAGTPFQLLNSGNAVVGCTAGAAVTSTFTNPTGLLANVQYWIGFMTDSLVEVQLADNGTTGMVSSNTYSNGAPPFINAPTTGLQDWFIYADLTTSALLEGRSYTYTWVTAYDEEGPPAPPTLVNGWSNGTWTIDLFTPPVPDMGTLRNITKTRIYRTVPDTSGGASFFFVAEVPVSTLSYTDIVDDSVIALNNLLPSAFWYPPPEDLQGMLAMPNGMIVGFRSNELWFCEPYRPHAWPSPYVLTTEFPIVGIGVNGNAVVAATSGTPYVAQGVAPSSMVLTKAVSPEPCISRGSVLGTDYGVFYASPNGLIVVNPTTGQAQNTTETWITREKWQELVPQQGLAAIQLSSTYFGFQQGGQVGFSLEIANDTDSFTIWPQPGGHRIGFNRMSSPLLANIQNVQIDPWTGIGLLISTQEVQGPLGPAIVPVVCYYDFSDPAPVIQPCTWRSKIMQQGAKTNFEAMKVYFSVPPNTPVQNATRNTAPTDDSSWDTLETGQYGIVRVYADGELVTTREIVNSGELLRILSGFKAEEWQFEFTSRVLISNVQIATSAKELANV